MEHQKLSAMTLEEIFKDKKIKQKAKVSQIGDWLLNGELPLDELLVFAEAQKGVHKASCMEAIEYATKKNPVLADNHLLLVVTKALTEEEPRIKWESAKIIGNIARLFPGELSKTIKNLLVNAGHKGTVVRWATAYALGEIIKLKPDENKKLLTKIEALCEKEEDNGVKKKYLDALKKIKK